MKWSELLPMWLRDNAADMRRREKRCLAALKGRDPENVYTRSIASLAKAHAEAAAVYERALSEVEANR